MADEEISKKIGVEGFKKIIKEYRLKLTEDEADQIFKIYDKSQSKSIFYDEMFRSILVC